MVSDYIIGYIKDNVQIQTMDILIQSYDVYRLRRAARYKHIYILFKGNLTIIDKKIENHIKIISNQIKDLDNLDENINSNFYKYFKVFSRDIENEKEYLTNELMDFLVEFRNQYQIEFDLVLKDKIYVRFYTKNMFEPKLFGNPIDETSIYQYYAITKFAEEIVNIFDN